ncbi:MAG: Mitochondrial small ribosomal subunit Rsm22 [Methanoregula sp. PtaU1.Bin051]|nr:MAG: Mitochondrial small ribosomal subunit Rsm22 [Methanoregula sp. PtaU1.Bin051]
MKETAGSYNLSETERQRTEAFLAARKIPAALEQAIEDYIAKKTGKPYNDPVILERLRRAVVAQKGDYWKAPVKRRLSYTKGYSVLGYLAYHFPVFFMQAEYLMQELAGAGLIKQKMMILDVGTGPGVVPLAVADFVSRLDNASADIQSIEQSEEHLEAFRFLTGAYASGIRNITIRQPLQADIRTIADRDIPKGIDLLVFSNVLNEFEALPVDRQTDLVMRFAGHVASDGTILVVEPAEEIAATRLRSLSWALQDRGLTIHSPCSFLYGTRCDPSRCWSFETQPDIQPTRLMKALAAGKEPYRYINTDIKYAYVIIRKDRQVRNPYRIPPNAKVARLSKLHQHINRRINVTGAKMSQDLGHAKVHVFRLCDGTPAKPVYAVLHKYHMNRQNTPLLSSAYGDILTLTDVLVRYNKKHDAYNLLAGKNTQVQVL